jgi:hypothetical protein
MLFAARQSILTVGQLPFSKQTSFDVLTFRVRGFSDAQVNIEDAKTHLPDLIDAALRVQFGLVIGPGARRPPKETLNRKRVSLISRQIDYHVAK